MINKGAFILFTLPIRSGIAPGTGAATTDISGGADRARAASLSATAAADSGLSDRDSIEVRSC